MKIYGAAKRSKTGCEYAISSGFAILLAVILFPRLANADGGMVRAKKTQGAFVVTIFSPAEIATGTSTDVTLLVQRQETGDVEMDAAVDLSFLPPTGANLSPNDVLCGPANNSPTPEATGAPGWSASIRATRARAVNKLLYGAFVVFPAAGDWQLRVTVRHGGEEANVTCVLPVELPLRRLCGLWHLLALPPFAVALFALNQWLRRRPAATIRVEIGRGNPATHSLPQEERRA